VTVFQIESDALAARIDPLGAELQSLTDAQGRQLMWSGDPAFWTGRAPILFPIVGRLNGDVLRVEEKEYPLQKHGFARHSRFELQHHDAASATFRLTDTPATRAIYPFAFVLDVSFMVAGATLAMTASIRNPGDAPLPASFGYHPAFVWPLPGGNRATHEIVFACDEPGPLRRVTAQGLIGPEPKPSPVSGNRFVLSDGLFADDALVWTGLNSCALSYGVPDGPHLDIAFPDTPDLGIWTKPGAGFICIEPWAGHADPQDYANDFRDKPGVIEIAPGAQASFRMDVSVRT
jgi:galactose mutarotase-like enzyme